MAIQNQNTYTTKSVKLAAILLQQKWSSYGNNKKTIKLAAICCSRNGQVSSNYAAAKLLLT